MKINDFTNSIPTISDDQVDRLYSFTSKHFIEYYDLQVELVDHLALAIEKQWELNPKLSFEEALNVEFKKFGIYGFSDIVERRKSEMNKRYHKFVWQHFKDFFTIPKILLTISLTVLLSILLISLKPYYGSLSFSLSISILAIVFFFAFRNKMVLSKKRKKRWMMEEVIANYGGAALLWYIPLHFFSITDRIVVLENNYGIFICSFLMVCWFLYSYIMIDVIPKKSQEYLQSVYPEYRLVM